MAEKPQDDAGVAAGRGVVFIGGAKMYFLVAGAVPEFTLPNLVGAAAYGAYGFVAQAVSIVNNVIVQGTIQTVSRSTTADPAHPDVVKATGLKMQLKLGIPLAILFALFAPVLAHLVHDSAKTGPLILAAGIIAGYSIYAVLVGSANGTRQFHKQAGLDITFSTLKAIGVVGGALLGLGVYGAIGGWVAAVGGVLMVASMWVGWPRGAKATDTRPMFRYMAGLVAYLILINLIMAADSLLLKRISTEWFVAHGLAADASHLADTEVGHYRTVQQLARLPYQLMVAVTFVIFPLMSQATFANDKETARGYIRTTMRYSLVFAGAMGAVLASNPGALLGVPFKPEYAAVGGPALAALALGHVAFALFTIGGSILNGAGLTRYAVIGAAATLVVLLVALYVGLPMATPGKPLLTVAGACTGGAMLLGALVTGVLLWREYKVFVPVVTALRVGIAAGAAIGVGQLVPAGGKMIALAGALAAGVAYLAALIVTRELTGKDLDRVRQVARGEQEMMKRAIMLMVVVVGACASSQKSTEDLLDTSLLYQEGLRWGRYEDAAAYVPPAAREDFLDDRDALADDLRIDDYEVIRVKIATRKDGAQIQVKYTWHLDSVGVVHETVVEQKWEQTGRVWLITEEVWKRGEKMPGVEVRVKKKKPTAPVDTASNP